MALGQGGFSTGGAQFSGNMGHREFARPRATPKYAGDKRFAPRRPHRLSAYVTGTSSKSSLSCFVMDSSSTGLLIEMHGLAATANQLPDRLAVYIPTENVEFDCHVVWRAGSRAGVRFATAARHFHKPASLRRSAKSAKPHSLIGRLFSAGG